MGYTMRGTKPPRGWNRCSLCGMFIAYDDFPEGVHTEFTPETAFTTETIEHYHIDCWERIDHGPVYPITGWRRIE